MLVAVETTPEHLVYLPEGSNLNTLY